MLRFKLISVGVGSLVGVIAEVILLGFFFMLYYFSLANEAVWVFLSLIALLAHPIAVIGATIIFLVMHKTPQLDWKLRLGGAVFSSILSLGLVVVISLLPSASFENGLLYFLKDAVPTAFLSALLMPSLLGWIFFIGSYYLAFLAVLQTRIAQSG